MLLFCLRVILTIKKKLKEVQEVLKVSSQPGPRGVNFSPSCDSSHCLSYFLRTFIVNLPINKLVYLVLCFLKGILEVVFGACDFLFCFLSCKELC